MGDAGEQRSARVEIDVGLDTGGLGYDEEVELAIEAARAGFGRIWTASGGDPFQTCALRWAATRAVRPGGIETAIGVVPVGLRSPADLAQSAAALSRVTGGRFLLGIGAGSAYQESYRRTWGLRETSPLALVRAYLTTTRALLAGERVTYEGGSVAYLDARLADPPPRTPVYLGANGPEMTRLAGELGDGVYLSWCTKGSIAAARRDLAAGAARVGRDPTEVRLAASFRVAIDDSIPAARAALASALLPYVHGWGAEPPRAYRAHFERMGFAAEVAELDGLRERGAAREELVEAFPDSMLRALGYFGPASGALEAMRRLGAEADVVVVRALASGPGPTSVRAVLGALGPATSG